MCRPFRYNGVERAIDAIAARASYVRRFFRFTSPIRLSQSEKKLEPSAACDASKERKLEPSAACDASKERKLEPSAACDASKERKLEPSAACDASKERKLEPSAAYDASKERKLEPSAACDASKERKLEPSAACDASKERKLEPSAACDASKERKLEPSVACDASTKKEREREVGRLTRRSFQVTRPPVHLHQSKRAPPTPARLHRKKAILLSSVGDKTYRIIKDVLSPDTPTAVSSAALVDRMTTNFQPAPSEIVQRFLFHTRVCQQHESVVTYIAQLKQIAESCNFGDAARMNEMLWDRLVCGIANERWQQRLLAEDGLTFEKAEKLLLSMETAEKGFKDIAGEAPKKVLYAPQPRRGKGRVPQKPVDRKSPPCRHCGAAHDPTKCRFRSYYCHKRGHISAICHQKAKHTQGPARAPLQLSVTLQKN